MFAAEREQLPDQRCSPFASFQCLFYLSTEQVLRTQFGQEDLAIAHDNGQEIIEIMRDPSGQPADRFHLLGLPKLFLALPKGLFRPFPFGAIVELTECTLDRGYKPSESLLEHIICRAMMHGVDCQFL